METRSAKSVSIRRMLLAGVLVVVAAMLVPLTGYVYVAMAQQSPQQEAQGDPARDAWNETNPRSEYWREVRASTVGKTRASGKEAGVLIQSGGENYRQLRNGPISTYGPWVLGLTLLGIGAVFALTGGTSVEKPLSGKRVPRWNGFDRFIHWVMAILFITLAITGLSLLFGRAVLIPVMGPEGFAAWASVAKVIHNYSGPVFLASLIVIVLIWARYNIPDKTDFDWLFKGGLFGRHVPSGKLNGGEKIWFWFNATFGLAVAVTGTLMVLPTFIESREFMQNSLLIHASLSLLWIAASFGHIYMGTAGVEGALDGMTKGHVSSEWAEQHHDLWYEEVKSDEYVPDDSDQVKGGGSKGGVASQPGSPA